MMKILLALAISVIAGSAMAQSGGGPVGGPANGTFYTSSSTSLSVSTCVNSIPSDCIKSDLVIKSRDKTVLIRGFYGCQTIASKLQPSSDVSVAECFH
jgi:hypothetical protein